ncbi:hypothetical protein [Spirosoma fluminis]
MIWLFRFGAAIDCLGVLITCWILLSPEINRPKQLSNKQLFGLAWLGVGLVGFSFYLKNCHYQTTATALVWLPGLPLLASGLLLVRTLTTKSTW